MRRKSTRNASKSTTATPSTPEPTRRTTRSSRRKKSPSPEIQQQQEEDKNEIINDSLNESLVEQQTESDVSNIIEKESDNKIDDDNVDKIEASHTPPHSGSSTSNIETTTTTSPTTETTITTTTTTTVDDQNDDTDDKGKSNSELNENSEIKMNSVDSISADVVNNQDDTVNNRDIEIEQQQTVDKACDEQLSVDDDNNEKKDSETVDKVIINLKTNGDIETSKDDVEQAEEGEITESKSDEETSHQNENVKKHSSIKIKLRRNSLFDEIDRKIEDTTTTIEDEVESKKKFKWDLNRYDCLKLTFNDMFKLNVDDFKELCTDLKLIDEKDVKLEEIYKPIIERTLSTDDNNDEEDHHHHDKNDKINLDDTETTNIIALNRKISIVDDSASKLKPPPSPAEQPISSILFISNLVRPFTIKQLKELLERTGTINEEGFWTDRIKSKCYVQYNSIEDAEATRNALHGVNWPIGNGKKLIIEYSTEEEMEKAKNPPSPPTPVPVTPQPVVQTTPPRAKTPQKENEDPIRDQRNGDRRDERKRKISEREKERGRPSTREWDIGKEKHSEKGRDKRRRHSERSVTPLEDFIARKQKKIEESVPQKLMDDLFQRTRAMPCIYWQPLTPEEISVKQQQRLTRMEEHKRRMEENSRNNSTRGGRGDAGRGAYRRRYD